MSQSESNPSIKLASQLGLATRPLAVPDAGAAGLSSGDRDPQQIMDDNISQFETGDLELERLPANNERMTLTKVPNTDHS